MPYPKSGLPGRTTSRGVAVSSLITLALYSAALKAQTSPKALDDITISSSPFRETAASQVSPATVLQGNALQTRLDGNLGTLLEQEPGITTSGHGPNSGRPIIRGLANDRVKILSNGSSLFDASNSSEDHAVPVNPIFADRIEVLRGANTLRYGGNAIGGVVNIIDDRTPVNLPKGQHGEVRLSGRLGSAQDTMAGHFALGEDNFAISVDAFDVRTSDLRVPGNFFSDEGLRRVQAGNPGATQLTGRLPNSSARTDGGSMGAALRGAWGYAGLSLQRFNNLYGIGNAASDEQPRIDMRQERNEFKGRLNTQGLFERVDLDAVNSRYQHSELVDEMGATVPELTFRNQGDETRIEALTRPFGATRASVGFHRSNSQFRAFNEDGNNTFVPNTRTTGDAVYLTATTQTGALQLQGGVRHENHRISGDASNDCAQSAQRRFGLNSGSVGARYALTAAHAVSAQLSHSERAPTAVELFACGRHEATFNAQYGNPDLPTEKANGIDVTWSFKDDRWDSRATVYQQDFSRFITLRADPGSDPNTVNPPDGPRPLQDGLPAFDYTSTRATLNGLELSATRILQPASLGLSDAFRPRLELRMDQTRGTDESSGQALPRITPRRYTVAGALEHPRGIARLQIVHHAAQDRLSLVDAETRTAGYTRVDAYADYRPNWDMGALRPTFFLQARNLTNVQGRNHVSFLKDFIPIQGRTVTVGMRWLF